ncbi:putative lipid II flippase FtsW [Balneatrix alpica]|uniref:Probable peptidoglycan glycosyltransferase FtsW n=1 Tax=Balneatrix alpica TaxID=75684 RepID=A0ABV5ZAS8_9GAMM|nr:putative lipid II flippase FtsW [Balneatrix alpica]
MRWHWGKAVEVPVYGRIAGPFDGWLMLAVGALLLIGLVMVTSASIEVAEVRFNDPFYQAKRHAVFMVVGLIIAALAWRVPLEYWQRQHWWCLLAAIVLLVLVLIPGVGRVVNGSARWLSLGPINIQASEVAKLFLMMYMASYLTRRLDEVRKHWSGFVKAMLVLVLPVILMLMEPDLGAAVVTLGIVFGMIFMGGMRMWQFLLVIASALAAVGAGAWLEDYRRQRLMTYLDPWADPYGSGYQLTQAQIAFGRGDWFGLGLGNSVQKLFYLPEAHTDFVYAVLAEELGLIGALTVIALYAWLVYRAFLIGQRAELLRQHFSAFMAYGTALLIAGQAFINIGVNVGVLPTKGLTLPLISYGGSSLVICLVLIAILLRVDYEARCEALRRAQLRSVVYG